MNVVGNSSLTVNASYISFEQLPRLLQLKVTTLPDGQCLLSHEVVVP